MDKNPFSRIIPELNKQQPRLAVEKFVVEHVKCRDLIPGDVLPSYRQFAAVNGVSEGQLKEHIRT